MREGMAWLGAGLIALGVLQLVLTPFYLRDRKPDAIVFSAGIGATLIGMGTWFLVKAAH